MDLMSKLISILVKEGKYEDISEASADRKVREKLLRKYDLISEK